MSTARLDNRATPQSEANFEVAVQDYEHSLYLPSRARVEQQLAFKGREISPQSSGISPVTSESQSQKR